MASAQEVVLEDGEEEDAELKELSAEISSLKERIKKAREEAADADFVALTDDIAELGYIKIKPRRKLVGHLAKVNLYSRHLLLVCCVQFHAFSLVISLVS